MTTPKPKARKAACVWVVELRTFDGKGWRAMENACYSKMYRARISINKMLQLFPKQTYRIRKYQRIDK